MRRVCAGRPSRVFLWQEPWEFQRHLRGAQVGIYLKLVTWFFVENNPKSLDDIQEMLQRSFGWKNQKQKILHFRQQKKCPFYGSGEKRTIQEWVSPHIWEWLCPCSTGRLIRLNINTRFGELGAGSYVFKYVFLFSSERSWILGNWRTDHGTMLRPQIFSENRGRFHFSSKHFILVLC